AFGLIRQTVRMQPHLLLFTSLFVFGACSSNTTEDVDTIGDDLGASAQCSHDAILARTSDPGRRAIIDRAYDWIDRGVIYNANGTDDGYRRDCSGYVSMAWQLSRPGPAPCNMPPATARGDMHNVDKTDLEAGDALIKIPDVCGPHGHIRLFGGWIDRGAGTF